MSWFSKKPRISTAEPDGRVRKTSRMQGLWVKCEDCNEIIYRQEVEKNLHVCTNCGYHLPWPARERLKAVLDPQSFRELDADLEPEDPLAFADSKKYRERLRAARKALQSPDAFVSGIGEIGGHLVSVGCFLFEFMGGSMGSVVGEKVARVFERGYDKDCPALIFSASGGARMQEGILSLMQMAKTSAALVRFHRRSRPYISVMLHPTTGGVAASFAWQGDVILAEPKALIGFAGPRVIEQTIRQKLPEGFQTAEFLLEHGMIDAIVARKELRPKLEQLLGLMG